MKNITKNINSFTRLASYLGFRKLGQFALTESIKARIDDGSLLDVKDEYTYNILEGLAEAYSSASSELDFLINQVNKLQGVSKGLDEQNPQTKEEELLNELQKDKVKRLFNPKEQASFNRKKQNLEDELLPEFFAAVQKLNSSKVAEALNAEPDYDLNGFNQLIQDMQTDLQGKCVFLKIETDKSDFNEFDMIQKDLSGYDDMGRGNIKDLVDLYEGQTKKKDVIDTKLKTQWYARRLQMRQNALERLNKKIEQARAEGDEDAVKHYLEEIRRDVSETGSLAIPKEEVLLRQREVSRDVVKKRREMMDARSMEGLIERLSQAIDSKKSDEKKLMVRNMIKNHVTLTQAVPEAEGLAKQYQDAVALAKMQKTPDNVAKVKELEAALYKLANAKVGKKVAEIVGKTYEPLKAFEKRIMTFLKAGQSNPAVLQVLVDEGKELSLNEGYSKMTSLHARLMDLVQALDVGTKNPEE